MAYLLNWILWMPVLGILGLFVIPGQSKGAIRYWSLLNTAITFVLTIILYMNFNTEVAGMQS
ncbi:MAG: NADH-quinone oxidoreductase subunit M, partial [Bdellovibrionales bacterium]|nr:NADH-quinone oxidoreductase subunit M [Bdellovibrionales bacterium]